MIDTTVSKAPTFTKPLRNIETMEGTNVHLECRLQPVGDNSMRVEWFVNDQPLKVGTSHTYTSNMPTCMRLIYANLAAMIGVMGTTEMTRGCLLQCFSG